MLARKAAGDEAVVEKLAADLDVPDEVLGFHAQQAVEKRLKAILADLTVDFERTHNLAYLFRLLEDHGVASPAAADELIALTPWATGFRYEDASDHVLDRPRVVRLIGELRLWAEDAVRRPL